MNASLSIPSMIFKIAQKQKGKRDRRHASPLELLGIFIGAERRRKGLDLQDAAQQLGVDVRTLLEIELGALDPQELLPLLPGLERLLDLPGGSLGRRLVRLALE